MEPKEPKVRRLKGEDDEPKVRKQKVEIPPQADEAEPHQPVQAQQIVKQDTIKIGKVDMHITYRDTTFFLLGLLCGVVL